MAGSMTILGLRSIQNPLAFGLLKDVQMNQESILQEVNLKGIILVLIQYPSVMDGLKILPGLKLRKNGLMRNAKILQAYIRVAQHLKLEI